MAKISGEFDRNGDYILKPCPCGKTPEKLYISDAGQGSKWALVSGGCCGEWSIEFRTSYEALDSDKCMEYAVQSWNETERGWEKIND